MADDTYTRRIQDWQQLQSQELIADPLNWLSLVGLFRLHPGDNSFALTATDNTVPAGIIMPAAQLPVAGFFRLSGSSVTLHPATAAPSAASGLTLNGAAPETRPLRNDRDGQPDLVEWGSLAMIVIRRGDQLLLRVWDRQAPALREFDGLRFFPINPAYRFQAAFTPYDPPRIATTLDVIGTEYQTNYVGQAAFTLDGVTYHLDAQEAGDSLLFVFSDMTRLDDTYPGGRRLLTPRPVDGSLLLDFNQACNWPCAYTSFATCPVPPPQNRLPCRLEAGEKRYRQSLAH